MSLAIENIFLSSANGKEGNDHSDEGETGVVVASKSGEKFYASFLSFNHLEKLRKQHLASGEFLSGKYFWSKNLVLVNDCDLPTVEAVVNDLIDNGDFQDAFLRL